LRAAALKAVGVFGLEQNGLALPGAHRVGQLLEHR
jgi:hypothetical protein